MIISKDAKRLSRQSVKKIRRMIAAVLANPNLYDQDTFGRKVCENEGDEACGTVCCAAGWAVWLENKALYNRLMIIELGENSFGSANWEEHALKALGLVGDDPNDAGRIFGQASDWPEPYASMYERARTPKRRAQVFAKRWEKFIASDGIV